MTSSNGFDPVGCAEIARRLGFRPNTVHKWRQRGVLPEPAGMVDSAGPHRQVPVWDWEGQIVPWAKATGRLPNATS